MTKAEDGNGVAAPAESSTEVMPTDAAEELGKMAGSEEDQGTVGQEDQGTAGEGTGEGGKSEGDSDTNTDSDSDSDADAEKGTEHRSERAEARIAELTKARKEQEARAAAAEAKAKELEARAAHEIGLHPEYVSAEESKLIQEANALEAREQFLLKNWEGYDDPKDPAKSKTGAEVREEYAQIRKQTNSKVARANALYEERLKQQTEDMLAGRKARLEREALGKASLGKPAAAKPPARTMAPPAAAGGKPMSAPGPKGGPDVERFKKAGADRNAAARELQELVGE